MLEYSQRRNAVPQATINVGSQQTRRLLLALGLLLMALVAVLIKDRDFWFGSESSIVEIDVPQTPVAAQPAARPAVVPPPAVPTHPAKKQITRNANIPSEPVPSDAPAVTTRRTVLPPLDVEVVAGATHHKLHPGSNATKLEIPNPPAQGQSAQAQAPATNAAQTEPVVETPQLPQLAQHMNVQGAVVLQALVGSDGEIENLRVLSGPAILASAAEQAVREWRFKPIVQNGQAVESKATITVNFSIKVADNSAKTTLAEIRASNNLIITR